MTTINIDDNAIKKALRVLFKQSHVVMLFMGLFVGLFASSCATVVLNQFNVPALVHVFTVTGGTVIIGLIFYVISILHEYSRS